MRGLLWSLVLGASGDTNHQLALLKRWQWLRKDEMETVQRERLAKLLDHARRKIPYYRDLFAERGMDRAKPMALVDALSSLPLLDKDTIRREGSRMLAADVAGRGAFQNTSGGSTGEPVVLTQDSAYRDTARAVAMLFGQWAGYDAGDPMVKLWGSERDLFVGRETMRTRGTRYLRNETWLNAFRMTPEQFGEYINVINERRPVFLLGYVESLHDLAVYADREGLRVHSPRSVMTAAGPLDAHVREVVARVFDAPVFNRYGSREVGDIASECSAHSGLHVCSPQHVVELLDPEGRPVKPGERGEVVVTLLTNYSMPLVRYRIGDVASWSGEECSCGRAWPLLENVAGRVSDIFVRHDGARVHGEYFTHLFYFLPWVRKFQVVQEAHNDVLVRIVPRERGIECTPDALRDMTDVEAKVRLVLGNGCRVRTEFCDNIEPTASGKFRYTISKVPV
ncbi:MAG TPA: hypothetical protein VGE02_05920 [Gemmatimonadales bacterium]